MISSDMLLSFVKVAEYSSVSKAAQTLALGKSVVSKRIGQLESQLGVTLFSRNTRNVALTAAGATYLEHARKVLIELSAAEERLLALRSNLEGKIRVTAPVSWGQRILSKRMPEFLRMHPGIELELILSDRKMDLATEGIDVAFRWSSVQDRKEHFVKAVANIEWMLVCAPQYMRLNAPPGTPQELEAHSCLFYWKEPSDDWWVMVCADDTVRVKVSGRYHVDNPESVLEACLQGLGVGMLPDYLCAEALLEERLIRVLPRWSLQTRFGNQITAMASPDRMRILRNKVLVDFVAQGNSPS